MVSNLFYLYSQNCNRVNDTTYIFLIFINVENNKLQIKPFIHILLKKCILK